MTTSFKDSGFITLVADMLEMNLKALHRTEKHVADHICSSTVKIEKVQADSRDVLSEIHELKDSKKVDESTKSATRGPQLRTANRVRKKVVPVSVQEEVVIPPRPKPTHIKKRRSSTSTNRVVDSQRVMFDNNTLMTIRKVDLSSLSRPDMLSLQERLSEAIGAVKKLSQATLAASSIQKYIFSEQRSNCINIYLEDLQKSKVVVSTMADVRKIAYTILSALKYLHSEGIPHGFLLWRYLNTFKDSDGIQVVLPPPLIDSAVRSDSFWARHGCYWTPQEMSGRSKKVPSLKSDIWQFGCLLLELVTGERPWAHLTQDFSNTTGPVELLLPKSVSKSPDLVFVFQQCLVRDESTRASVDDLLRLPFFVDHSMKVLSSPVSLSPTAQPFQVSFSNQQKPLKPRNVAVPRPLDADLLEEVHMINTVEATGSTKSIKKPEFPVSPLSEGIAVTRVPTGFVSGFDDEQKYQRSVSSPLRVGTPASVKSAIRSPLRTFDKNIKAAVPNSGRKITSDVESLIERADRTEDMLSRFEKTLVQFTDSQAATNNFLLSLMEQQKQQQAHQQQTQFLANGVQPVLIPEKPRQPTLLSHSQPFYSETQPFTIGR